MLVFGIPETVQARRNGSEQPPRQFFLQVPGVWREIMIETKVIR